MMLKDEIALVTGASRGIGSAIAMELGRLGAMVLGTATTPEGAHRIGDKLEQAHFSGAGLVLDVTDTNSIETLMSDVSDRYCAPSILVNNAGITRDNLLMRLKDDDWGTVINTNLNSVYRMSKACLRGMIKARKGRIVNITSVVGSIGNPGQSNYCAAKAGIEGFTRSLAREIGSRGITVNSVAPGFIDTDMTRGLPEEQRKAMLGNIPLGRFGSVDDIAQAVAFLVSPAAGYITGTTLHINGGMHMA